MRPKDLNRIVSLLSEGKTVNKIAELMSVSKTTVYRVRNHTTPNDMSSRKKYLTVEKDIIISNYKLLSNSEISILLQDIGFDRNPKSISKFLAKNGCRRSKSQISSILSKSSMKRKRLKGRYIEVNGVIIKKCQYIWEQENGKIPDGKSIYFLNGNNTDFRIENLSIIKPNTMIEGLEKVVKKKGLKIRMVVNGGKWIPFWEYIWNQNRPNSETPKTIHFINEDPMDCRFENLSPTLPIKEGDRVLNESEVYERIQDSEVKRATLIRNKQCFNAIVSLNNYNQDKMKKKREKVESKKQKVDVKKKKKKINLNDKSASVKQIQAMTPQERFAYNRDEVKGKIKVTDYGNRATRYLTPKQHKKYLESKNNTIPEKGE